MCRTNEEGNCVELMKGASDKVLLYIITDEVTVTYRDNHSLLSNLRTGTEPMVVHGNGPIKVKLSGDVFVLHDD